MKRLAPIVLVTLLAGACGRGAESGSGVRLSAMGGDVQVQHDDVWRTVTGPISLARGDLVKTGKPGRALVELPTGTLELRPETEVRMGAVPELNTGSVLARSVSGLAVGVGDVRVEADKALYRLDRSFSVRVGVYGGEVALPGSGWGGTVGPLRQVGVVAGAVPRGPVALQVDPSDPWDDRILGQAIEIGGSLERYQQGLADQLPSGGGKEAVARVVQLDAQAVLAGVSDRASASRLSEAVVAWVVASTAAPARKAAFREVMALRDLGASWIVVAAEWQLARSVVEALLQVTGLLSRAAASSPAATGSGAGAGGDLPGSTGGTQDGGPGGGGSVGGPTEPPPLPPPDCTDLINCTVEDVLDLDVGDGVAIP